MTGKSAAFSLLALWSVLFTPSGFAQNQAAQSALPNAPSMSPAVFRLQVPNSKNPIDAYRPSQVPEPELKNSQRLYQLIRDGKLYLSLNDAIELALEDNLDLAIARYNLPIADTDILRTRAGGVFRGVN